jgi:hypothetical protein
MAAGIVLVSNANAWIVTFASSAGAGFTLPFDLWPGATEPNRSKPFVPWRLVWVDVAGTAGDQVIITDNAGNEYVHFVSTGADYEPPQEWKRSKGESGPVGAIITRFDSGELTIYF